MLHHNRQYPKCFTRILWSVCVKSVLNEREYFTSTIYIIANMLNIVRKDLWAGIIESKLIGLFKEELTVRIIHCNITWTAYLKTYL